VPLLIVNYHYVRSDEAQLNGLHGLTLSAFRAQLDVLERVAEPLGPAELRAAVRRRELDPRPYFVLTFDDGLAEHASLVPAELRRRGLPALFFVPSAPWEGRMLQVHKTHLLLATGHGSAVREHVATAVGEPSDETRAAAAATYRYDDAATAELKYLLNYRLEPEVAATIVAGAFAEFFGAEAEHARQFYLGPGDCRALVADGFEVGLHSHAHVPLARLSAGAISRDLRRNRRALEDATGVRPTMVAYPYGGADAVNPTVIGVARELGLELGFTMRRGFARIDDDPLAIARVDTNDAPGGKRPRIAFAREPV
jgi:peptidoglycan/xylan/chitin deacetylase (PgdA/CDA1 family)